MDTTTRLEHFGFLSITGRDANKFLQGYTTCDLNDLDPDHSLPGAICNIQGRMVSNFQVAMIADGYLLRMHRELVPKTMEFLKKYIYFSKAEMADVSVDWHCQGRTQSEANDVSKVHEISHTDEGMQITVDRHRSELWTQAALPADGSLVDWQQADITEGIAWLEPATSETFIPQMINLASRGGISFDKGCYLGQEIVARMQYRGELKRRLHRGTAEAEVAAGDTLLREGEKAAGTVVCAVGASFLAVIQNTEPGELVLTLPGGAAVKAELAA